METRRTFLGCPHYVGYIDEMTATQLTALKKKDLKLWEHITEIRAKQKINN
jgi:hypothetical protein